MLSQIPSLRTFIQTILPNFHPPPSNDEVPSLKGGHFHVLRRSRCLNTTHPLYQKNARLMPRAPKLFRANKKKNLRPRKERVGPLPSGPSHVSHLSQRLKRRNMSNLLYQGNIEQLGRKPISVRAPKLRLFHANQETSHQTRKERVERLLILLLQQMIWLPLHLSRMLSFHPPSAFLPPRCLTYRRSLLLRHS